MGIAFFKTMMMWRVVKNKKKEGDMAPTYKILFRDSYGSTNKEVNLTADSVITDDIGRLTFKLDGKVVGVFKWEFVAAYYVA